MVRDGVTHHYPFAEFPVLESVVPPHFMIFKAGSTLAKGYWS